MNPLNRPTFQLAYTRNPHIYVSLLGILAIFEYARSAFEDDDSDDHYLHYLLTPQFASSAVFFTPEPDGINETLQQSSNLRAALVVRVVMEALPVALRADSDHHLYIPVPDGPLKQNILINSHVMCGGH